MLQSRAARNAACARTCFDPSIRLSGRLDLVPRFRLISGLERTNSDTSDTSDPLNHVLSVPCLQLRIDPYQAVEWPRGHTGGDTWIVFPVHATLHSGDIFPGKNLPFLDANNGGSGVDIGDSLP